MQCLAASVLEYNNTAPSELAAPKKKQILKFLRSDNRITDYCCWSYPGVIRGYTYINSRGGGLMEQWLKNGRNQIRDSPHIPLHPLLWQNSTCSSVCKWTTLFSSHMYSAFPVAQWQINASFGCNKASIGLTLSSLGSIIVSSTAPKILEKSYSGKTWKVLKLPFTDLAESWNGLEIVLQ